MNELLELKQAYINTLSDYSKSITPQVRQQLLHDLEISEPTLNKYLAGNIKKFDVAETLITYLSDKLGSKSEAATAN